MKTTSNGRRDRPTMNANTEADDAYREARDRVDQLLKELNRRLTAHGARQFRGDRKDWSYAGSMNHVAEILDEAITFLGGDPRS